MSKSERRWIEQELENGWMSESEALELVTPNSKNVKRSLRFWCEQFSSEIVLTLPVLSEKERQKIESL
ncbi:MAG: hypothetical protein IPM47_02040 [Sphingobacteriales bacterium]|nr:MAG: hypothetical protein IPM47_02040 [Sphingobacteriales bacterium]